MDCIKIIAAHFVALWSALRLRMICFWSLNFLLNLCDENADIYHPTLVGSDLDKILHF
jgi:hypothetical protein